MTEVLRGLFDSEMFGDYTPLPIEDTIWDPALYTRDWMDPAKDCNPALADQAVFPSWPTTPPPIRLEVAPEVKLDDVRQKKRKPSVPVWGNSKPCDIEKFAWKPSIRLLYYNQLAALDSCCTCGGEGADLKGGTCFAPFCNLPPSHIFGGCKGRMLCDKHAYL